MYIHIYLKLGDRAETEWRQERRESQENDLLFHSLSHRVKLIKISLSQSFEAPYGLSNV